MKYAKIIVTSVVIFLSGNFNQASASCTQDANGDLIIQRVAGTQLTATCKSDIQQYDQEITQLGLCASFPISGSAIDVGLGLAQCQNLLSQPLDVSLSIGSSQSISALGPEPGTYNFFYRLVPARAKYKALWKFSQSIVGGNGTNVVNANQSGTWCYPAPFEYTTSTIFDGIRPNVCVNSEPSSLPLSTYFFDNVGFSSWEAITSVPVPNAAPLQRQYQIDTDAYQNILLVDSNLNVIQSESAKGDTEYVVAIQKLDPPLEVSAGSPLVFETTLTDKARVSIGCSADINTSCVVNTPYTVTSLDLKID